MFSNLYTLLFLGEHIQCGRLGRQLVCRTRFILNGEMLQYARERLIAFAPGAYQYFTILS